MLLLLAAGFLFAVESDPSAVVGYVKYDMVIGNNFVAIPMDCPWSMASELGAAFGGTVDQIGYYDPATQAFVTAADLGFMWTDDFPIDTNSVLMLYSSVLDQFYSIGDLPATNATFNLVAGNNAVMVPLNKSNFAMASEIGVDMVAGNVDQVGYFDPVAQSFVTAADLGFMWTDDFSVSIAMPLMAYSSNAFIWPSRAAVEPLSANKKSKK